MKYANFFSIRKIKSLALAILTVIFCVMIFFSAAAIAVFGYFYFTTPLGQQLTTRDIPKTSLIYDRTGARVLYEIHGEENRRPVSRAQIPDTIRMATIAAEDSSFFSHHGIDFPALFRSAAVNLKSGRIKQGGSTITQQLARNAFLTREKTVRRKILETVLAVKIENKYGKDEILDAYLNEVPYGSNAYGIEAAARTFFQKPAIELALDEAALLAALPKATSFYSPFGDNSGQLLVLQRGILDRILQLGMANEKEVAAAKQSDVLAKISPVVSRIEAPHFVFYVLDELEKKYGKKTVREGGLRVYTTLDFELQKTAEKIVHKGTEYNQARYGGENAALTAIDPQNGQILVMVGSRDYFDPQIDGEVNVAIRPRQPGSSFKPFAYAKAFEKGYQPETLILDAQTNFGPDGEGIPYVPRNYDGRFHGMVTMRQALAMSLNIPAVKTMRAVGIDEVIELAQRLGITTLNNRDRYGLSLVVGGGEVTLLDETAGFSVFANDGKRNPIDPFLKITDSRGKVLYVNEPKNIQVLDPQVARKINSVLSDNAARAPVFGTDNNLRIPNAPVAAKTGTTQEFRDAWTVGYTPEIAAGVWVGNNDNRSMRSGADGSYAAAPIWNNFMRIAMEKYSGENFLAYEPDKNGIKLAEAGAFRISYFDRKKGKEISTKKARRKNPEKIEIRIEMVAGAYAERQETSISATDLFNPSIFDWEKISREN